ncbi:pyroglutamyl-peptidase I [Evansella halocellulosilytica]|uniref:pyroglutamyl-peptidase I n=1 Tax=Evansella halocellulosilytica TaxID=2011013 RepID=UPI000BB94415|nr:pyroglutamyl-peptidase I [Evansella halocellulosilytica]
MNTLLLTGFEPFLDFPLNPTMEIVNELDGELIGDYRIVGKILTVDFSKSGDQLIREIETVNPDAVISLGLAGGRFKITPERIAINCNDGEEDNYGYKPDGERIVENGSDGLFSTLPIKDMVSNLTKAGFPAEISNTAGTYLCNNVMYRGLSYFQKDQKSVPSGFIHIPASHQLAVEHGKIASWSHDDLVKSIRICIKSL